MNRPAIKFCGMTRVEDAWAAADVGAAAVGFVFWPGSRRAVAPETAKLISRTLPPFLQRVGVFVNAPIEEMRRVAQFVGLDVLQLHGEESPLTASRAGYPVIKALGRRGGDLLAAADAWSEEITLLVDAEAPGEHGGTGRVADWEGASALARERRIVLAGGLSVENVGEAIRIVQPYAVDVASGIEDEPGRKNHRLMRAFAWAVESAWRRDAGDDRQD